MAAPVKKQRENDRPLPTWVPLMILSLKAGGVGLNLTRANHVFHFDRWWNPAVENQLIASFALVKLAMSRCINLSALGLWKNSRND